MLAFTVSPDLAENIETCNVSNPEGVTESLENGTMEIVGTLHDNYYAIASKTIEDVEQINPVISRMCNKEVHGTVLVVAIKSLKDFDYLDKGTMSTLAIALEFCRQDLLKNK